MFVNLKRVTWTSNDSKVDKESAPWLWQKEKKKSNSIKNWHMPVDDETALFCQGTVCCEEEFSHVGTFRWKEAHSSVTE